MYFFFFGREFFSDENVFLTKLNFIQEIIKKNQFVVKINYLDLGNISILHNKRVL